MRILVADDNRDAADSLADLLRIEFGCEVGAAYDGAAALAQALAEPPDIVILDIQMPQLGGLEVARRLHAAWARDAVRPLMVAMTGWSDVAAELGAIDSSFDHAFAKPVRTDELLAALTRHWQGHAGGAAPNRFEFSDLFTQVAREAMPMILGRGQTLSFDYRGPALVLHRDEAALHSGLYRLLCGTADMLDAGCMIFTAQAQPREDDGWRLEINAAGTGELAEAARIDRKSVV